MAGTATHLAVADLICNKLGNEKFKSLSLFYSGNIAPDAVHSRAGYIREYKKQTHLTTGLGGADFQDPEKVKIFHRRLCEYIEKYLHKENGDYDLYLGYVCHLVTDEFFNIDLRKKMVANMASDGLATEGPELARAILSDMDIVDRQIMANYPFKNDVRSHLSEVWDLEVCDMVSSDETNRSKQWVIDKLFCKDCDDATPKYYSYREALSFIEYCADNIIERFGGNTQFAKLF